MLSVRKVCDWDVDYLIPRIRESDRNEIAALSGRTVLQVLPISVQISRVSKIIQNESGDPVAIFGVADGCPDPYGVVLPFGVVWLLGTYELEGAERTSFIRLSRDLIPMVMLPRYRFLHNYCWSANQQSLRWLKWCGFTVTEPVRIGQHNELFFPFFLINKDWKAPCATPSR